MTDWDKYLEAFKIIKELSDKYPHDASTEEFLSSLGDAMWEKDTNSPKSIKRFVASWKDECYTPVEVAYAEYLATKNYSNFIWYRSVAAWAVMHPELRPKFLKGASFGGFRKAMEDSGFEVVTGINKKGKPVDYFRGRYIERR